jgi:cyclase
MPLAWKTSSPSASDRRLASLLTSWRRPDVVFDEHAEVDLGGRTVQLWHFGPVHRHPGRFKSTLGVKTIVPGHGPLADARSLDAWMAYLRELLEAVTRARRLGLSALATVETVPLPRGHGFPPWHPAARVNWLVQDLHRLNVLATYRHLERQPTAA